MTEEEKREYAEYLIRSQINSFEYITIFEVYGEYSGDFQYDVSDEDARDIDQLIHTANVEVSWE